MKKKIRAHYLVRKNLGFKQKQIGPITSFFLLLFLIIGVSITYYLLDGGKYAKIYAQLIDLQNINYEQKSEILKLS